MGSTAVRRARRHTESRRGRGPAIIGLALIVLTALTGCFPAPSHAAPTATPTAVDSPTPTPTPTPTPDPTTPAAPPPPDPAVSHRATPEPDPRPSPTLTPVPAGTVVARDDVASPKGSIHFHYEVVANGDNTYSVHYSDFTSTVPVPISTTLLVIAPKVGDGLTWHGVGDHQLGGPTTDPTARTTASLGSVGQPGYLTTLVTYSSVAAGTDVPIELGPNKVLAVNRIEWSIPVRDSNVHPVDGGTRAYAAGTVTATTAAGAPKRYLVAPDDITSVVAQRFGISVRDLIWLNANLQVFGAQQYLYAGTTLNLDPDSL